MLNPKVFDMTREQHRAYLAEKYKKVRLAYARRMGRRLANITKHGESLTDLGVARGILQQYGVEQQFMADAIVAGRMKNARLGEAA
jgi:hypothetical protein